MSGPVRPGDPVTFRITVTRLGADVTDVRVADPLFTGCARDLGALTAGAPSTYTCEGPAPAGDVTNVATVTAVDAFGAPLMRATTPPSRSSTARRST